MKVQVKLEIYLPDVQHAEEDLRDFLRVEFEGGRISGRNPFLNSSPDVELIEFKVE